jgi:hypothetical protein
MAAAGNAAQATDNAGVGVSASPAGTTVSVSDETGLKRANTVANANAEAGLDRASVASDSSTTGLDKAKMIANTNAAGGLEKASADHIATANTDAGANAQAGVKK